MSAVAESLLLLQATVAALDDAPVEDRAPLRTRVRQLVDELCEHVSRPVAADILGPVLDIAPRLAANGAAESADVLLTRLQSLLPPESDDAIRVRIVRARVAMRHDRLDDASALLRDALVAAGHDHPALQRLIVADLAAASFLAGDMATAERWVRTTPTPAGADPVADMVLATVAAAIEKVRSRPAPFRAAAERKRAAIGHYLDSAREPTPHPLSALASAAVTEFDIARTDGAPLQAERALDLLDVVLTRTSALLGATHPTTLTMLCTLATAEFDLSRDDGTATAMERTRPRLRDVADRTAAHLGPAHRLTLTAAANLATAQLETARAVSSTALATDAMSTLRQVLYDTETTLGRHHPHTLTVLATLATAEFEVATAERDPHRVRLAEETLAAALDRTAATLGADHPMALVAEQQLQLCQEFLADGSGPGWGFADDYVSYHAAANAIADVSAAGDRSRRLAAEFREFYQTYRPMIRNFVRLVGPRLDSAAITSEALRLTWLNWHNLGEDTPRSLAFRIARNLVYSRLPHAPAEPSTGFDDTFVAKLFELMPIERDALILESASLSRAEIAAVLGCASTTAALYISRARKEVHRLMSRVDRSSWSPL